MMTFVEGTGKPVELNACPFCGLAGEYHTRESRIWNGGMRPMPEPISVQITHHCPHVPGAIHAYREVRARDEACAIAQWNRTP